MVLSLYLRDVPRELNREMDTTDCPALAVVGKRQEMARLMVEKGAEAKGGWTPLHCAARHWGCSDRGAVFERSRCLLQDTDGSPARAVAETEEQVLGVALIIVPHPASG